jgi:hypothetical protein
LETHLRRFSPQEFFPESENDITCYLYYSLVAHEGITRDSIYTRVALTIEEVRNMYAVADSLRDKVLLLMGKCIGNCEEEFTSS